MTELTTATDGAHVTVRMPDNHEWVRESLEKACAAEARRQLETTPTPDPACSVPRTAELLDLHPETLRDYMRLPENHPRRLHYLTGESSRGDRVLLSQIHDWQRRNRTDAAPATAPAGLVTSKPPSSTRPSSKPRPSAPCSSPCPRRKYSTPPPTSKSTWPSATW